MEGLCDLTLDKLGNISNEVHIEDYSQFDVLTGVRISVVSFCVRKILTKNADQVSWQRALNTIDMRIGSRSHDESESLRYWKGVIEKAYADFQANLPGYEPCLLGSMTLSEDGRMADSEYPNFLLHEEREPYGL